MSTLPEQISAARKSHLEAQINFFQNYTTRALESVQKIVALNLSVSRASLEKSSAAVVELLAAKDPRDLFAMTTRTQESIDGLLAYTRALVAITTGAGASLAEAKPPVPALALVKATPQPEPEVPAPEFVAPVAEPEAPAPVAVTATPAAPPEATPTPIAKAAGKVVSKALAAKPAAAPVPAPSAKPIAVKGIKPVEASPPPAPVSGKPAAQQQLDLPASKSKKKK